MKIFFIFALFLLTSCNALGGPKPFLMDADPEGPPEFKAGWKDGCQSGFATYGTALNKMYYSFYQDFNMLKNPSYNAAWHEAFDYCRHYNLKWNTHDWTAN